MKNSGLFKLSAIAGAIAMITACGGSGGGTGTESAGNTSVGVITGFGSIYVNGVKYDTSKITPVIDGQSLPETTLGVGDVVAVTGTINADGVTGTATAVSCDDELEGYVLEVNLGLDGTGTINVMGQTVTVTTETVFDGDSVLAITDLVANDIVEVSGFSDGSGLITATRIESKDASEDVEVKGLVAGIDTLAQTFMLGSLTVNYGSATEIPEGLANGLYVEAKTDNILSGNVNDGFTMLASKVEIEDDGDMDIEGEAGEEVQVTGIVTNITETSFDFNGSNVKFAELDLEDDFSIESLTEGMMITVEGYFDANNQLVVTEIEDEPETEDEIMGTVTEVGTSSISISSGNEVMTFIVNYSTRMIDERDQGVVPVHYFSLDDIASGDYVEIEYYTDDASGDKIATEVEREDAPE